MRDSSLVIFQAWRESRRQMMFSRVVFFSSARHRAERADSPARVGPALRRLISTREELNSRAARMASTPSELILLFSSDSRCRVLLVFSMAAISSAVEVAMPQPPRSSTFTEVFLPIAATMADAYLSGFIWKDVEPFRLISGIVASFFSIASIAFKGDNVDVLPMNDAISLTN